ncbi:MAG: PilZ domain-containing protein [bacterium]
MSEARREERYKLSQEVEVFNELTGTHIGMIGNISRHGMMLISDKELPVDGSFQFRLDLPEPIAGNETLKVGLHSLWCEKGAAPGCYWVGFEIIDIADQDIERLDTLVKAY